MSNWLWLFFFFVYILFAGLFFSLFFLIVWMLFLGWFCSCVDAITLTVDEHDDIAFKCSSPYFVNISFAFFFFFHYYFFVLFGKCWCCCCCRICHVSVCWWTINSKNSRRNQNGALWNWLAFRWLAQRCQRCQRYFDYTLHYSNDGCYLLLSVGAHSLIVNGVDYVSCALLFKSTHGRVLLFKWLPMLGFGWLGLTLFVLIIN